jgi:hypothetical protein
MEGCKIMLEANEDRVVVDYYAGAYGPTIRVAINSLEHLKSIRDLFASLAAGQLKSVKLSDVIAAKVSGMKSLHLERIFEERVLSKSLAVVGHQAEGPEFVWSQSALGWIECAELINSIVKNNRPGHQYLTIESVDDALVEISYRE